MLNVRTDRTQLIWLCNLSKSTGPLAQNCLQISDFDIEVNPHAGLKSKEVNAALKLFTTREEVSQLEKEFITLVINPARSTHVLTGNNNACTNASRNTAPADTIYDSPAPVNLHYAQA